MLDQHSHKSVAQLRALAGAWREKADNTTSANLAEQMLRTAKEFDELAEELEKAKRPTN